MIIKQNYPAKQLIVLLDCEILFVWLGRRADRTTLGLHEFLTD